jgi:hypothetical protein
MHYLIERYYLEEGRAFPLRKGILVTATTVSRWCRHFGAELIVPVSEEIRPMRRSGVLPKDRMEREALVGDLVNWLLDNSLSDTLFCLLLHDGPLPKSGGIVKFSHYDGTHDCLLDLNIEEFATLQATWQAHGLPQDLFYADEDTVAVPYPGQGVKARFLRWMGATKIYTPRQWQAQADSESRET